MMMDAHSNQLTVKQTDTRSQLKRNKKENNNNNNNNNNNEKPLKVVYIANPLRVTLNASEFKEKVQKLTGRHSEIAEIMFQQSVVATDHSPELYEEKEEGTLCPLASTDVQGSTSTMRSSGASMDPSKDDFTLLDPYYEMAMESPFTDLLYHNNGFRRGYFDETDDI